MTRLRLTLIATAAMLSLLGGQVRAELQLGDAAPPLKIADWIKGDPVNLDEGQGKNIYVVEFWATWCGPCRESIPHLTKVQKDYKDNNVIVIGVSDEPASTIEPFVRKMGERMEYTVAADRDQKTGEAYMAAAGLSGIPHAFIVGKDGKIAWHGHPLEKMESVLDQLIAGTYDVAAARERMAKMKELNVKLEEAFAGENWDGVLAVVETMNQLDPNPVRYHQIRFHCQTMKGDLEGANSSGVAILEAANDTGTLNGFAWMLLTDQQFAGKFNPLALRIATKANEMSKGEDWSIVDTYARALFDTGDVKGAIEQQKKAISLAEEASVQAMGQLKVALTNYEKAAGETKSE